MVAFVEDFLRARTPCGDTLRVGRPSSCDKSFSWSCEIDSAASEVERVFDATHVAIVVRRPAAASDT